MTGPDGAALKAMVPLADTLGIEIIDASSDLVTATMAWAPERCTVQGVLHGGALMSLADTAGAICAFLNLPPGALSTATIESKTNLVRAVTEGAVTARSRPVHVGRTLALIESTVHDEHDRLVAKTTQTQIYHHPRD
jgi:uncharacterized protein (TIGR00369 family)